MIEPLSKPLLSYSSKLKDEVKFFIIMYNAHFLDDVGGLVLVGSVVEHPTSVEHIIDIVCLLMDQHYDIKIIFTVNIPFP